jgi:hypothetical protein
MNEPIKEVLDWARGESSKTSDPVVNELREIKIILAAILLELEEKE